MQTPLLHSRLRAARSLPLFVQLRGRGLFRFLPGLMLLSSALSAQAQTGSVGINTDGSTADASALLDVKSTTHGYLIQTNQEASGPCLNPPSGSRGDARIIFGQVSISTFAA